MVNVDVNPNQTPIEFIELINGLIRSYCHSETTALFLYLPKPSTDINQQSVAENYLYQLNKLTFGLPPTLLAHGLHEVTSTEL